MNLVSVLEQIKDGENNDIHRIMEMKEKEYHELNERDLQCHLVSEANWYMRKPYTSCEQLGVRIRVGDICYIDFGRAYLNEAGFQHFGLIMNIFNHKAFVIPMTSNIHSYQQAYDEVDNPFGKKHLMRIGLIRGLHKESVLFLNDAKFINSARIIDVKANLSINGKLFKQIQERFQHCLLFIQE